MSGAYEIDPDIRKAHTLPGSFYRDAEAYEALRERAFARSWQWIGHDSDFEPGSATPHDLLPGLLDEPLVVTRESGGELHVLSNVCTHRGNLVVGEATRCSGLRCEYHGRRFGLDGRFESMPEFEAVLDFPTAADDLPRLASSEAGGFRFAALESQEPFEPLVAEFLELVGHLPLADLRLDAAGVTHYSMAAHWALYVENYLEGFHVPFVHPGLAKELDYEAYRTELFPRSSLQIGSPRGDAPTFELAPGGRFGAEEVAGAYFWLFPATMLNVYPWGVSVNVVRPEGLERTTVSFYPYVLRPELRGQGAGGALDEVELEDERVVEAVQRGVRSRLYGRGRYSPTRETATHHFHRLLVGALG